MVFGFYSGHLLLSIVCHMASMHKKKYRPNLSEIVYYEIKQMILSGELPQGHRIILDEMAERLNLSITPVREGLNKLAQEDLVHMSPRTFYRVMQFDKKAISDIYDLRELLETYALRSSGDSLSQFPVAYFRDLCCKSLEEEDCKKFIQIDIEFHKRIVALSSNLKLPKMFNSIYNAIRILSIPSARLQGRIAKSQAEHIAILDAIETNEVEHAVSALSFHIKRTKHLYLKSFDSQQEMLTVAPAEEA